LLEGVRLCDVAEGGGGGAGCCEDDIDRRGELGAALLERVVVL